MTKYLFLLGAGALVAAAPAAAKPEGHGKSHHASEWQHGNKHSNYSKARYYGYGRTCPPGLHRKHNGCMPPGQLKRMYNRGQRYNTHYGSSWSYSQIPTDLRQQYGFNSNYRYYY